jgi:hypothetical protein
VLVVVHQRWGVVGTAAATQQLGFFYEGGGGRVEGHAQHDKQHVKEAVAFWGDVAVHWVVLLKGRHPCDGQRACRQWHLGGRCGALGGVIGGEATVRDTVEVVGERRWCNGPCRGRGPQRLGTMQQCDGRCCQGKDGGATDNRGRCSGVFVFYLYMGMGEIHWREEVDPIIIIE